MNQVFNSNPILNSPYSVPEQHWQLKSGRPTGEIQQGRRPSIHLVPIPKSERNKSQHQDQLDLEQKVKENPIVNRIRAQVDGWRKMSCDKWGVTYATQKLLIHWRDGASYPRPFFCQIEAAETFVWLNEVAHKTSTGRRILQELKDVNHDANPKLMRFASKMATGSGKTTVMAMMIAYHTINKSRYPKSQRFANNFLIVTPGITIKDRLRVLLPNDPTSTYTSMGILPPEFYSDIKSARIVITNYHAFRRREKYDISPAARSILKGNNASASSTIETEGQMLERVCKDLLSASQVIVINDEAHHCYRHKIDIDPNSTAPEEELEIQKNNKAARQWITGIETLSQKTKLKCVYDLSATPFFLQGSGYEEGQLFPWVISDFALMDAIECGIAKLPRVPVDDGTVTFDNVPIYRNLYQRIRKELPQKGIAKLGSMRPVDMDIIPRNIQLGKQTKLKFHLYLLSFATTPPLPS